MGREIGKSSRDFGKSRREIGKSRREIGISRREIGKSEREIGISRRDFGISRRNIPQEDPDLGMSLVWFWMSAWDKCWSPYDLGIGAGDFGISRREKGIWGGKKTKWASDIRNWRWRAVSQRSAGVLTRSRFARHGDARF